MLASVVDDGDDVDAASNSSSASFSSSSSSSGSLRILPPGPSSSHHNFCKPSGAGPYFCPPRAGGRPPGMPAAASASPSSSSCGPDSDREAAPVRLDYSNYELFHLCLHRALCPDGTPWDLGGGRALAKQNWAADSQGRPFMARADFERALVQVARNWALDVAERKIAVGMRLLAAEAGLLDDLETVFLACLAALVVRPAPRPSPYASPAPSGGPAARFRPAASIKPWFDVKVGCCSSQGNEVLQLLSALAAEALERRRAASSDSGSDLEGKDPEGGLERKSRGRKGASGCGCGPGAGDREAPRGGAEGGGGGEGPMALRRFALNNRMGRLLRIRRALSAGDEEAHMCA
eukprot:tig00000545_g2007.t1